ncbi:MAG: hypothetical protein IJ944_06690 [Clostridia bacterium]|nr:hypothetical protein [Clostridia bacterium]
MLTSALVFAQAEVTVTNTLIHSFDSTTGISSAFHTSSELEVNEKTEGEAALKMGFIYPTGQAVNIGGMIFFDFAPAKDLSAFDGYKIDVFSPVDMNGMGGVFQINFVTDAAMQDGYNFDLNISNIKEGWNTLTFDKNAFTAHVNDANWAKVDRIRLTWFNNSQVSREYLLLDNLCGVSIEGTPDPHTCTPNGDAQYDDSYHWYKCGVLGCKNIVGQEAHSGGIATCNSKAYCTVCENAYGELNPDKHVGGTEVRNGSATYSGDTYCLGCGIMTAQGHSTASTDTSKGHTPYVVGKDLMINNADSLNGWEEGLYSTTLSAGTVKAEGSGSVAMTASVPKGQGANVGAMTALNFPSADFTPYLKLQIKMHVSAKLTGTHTIQFNFITGTGGDGYNFDYAVTDLAAGWHTITVDRLAITKVVASEWSSINRIRFTWFNHSQISTKIKFTFDEIKALASTAHVPYMVGNDMMINNCDTTGGWQVGMYHTTITQGTQIAEGSGSVTLGCTYAYGQAGNVGSMTRLFFTPTDLTPYNSIQFKVFIDADLPGLHQFQANFITGDREDGFNQTYTFKDFESGWHTFTFDKHSLEQAVDTADWSSINAIRFTWFNLEPIPNPVNFTLDSIMALSEEHICTPDKADFNEEEHWYSCETEGCAEAVDQGPHYGGENTCSHKATCVDCGYVYGEIDENNHANTTLLNESETYTGDLWCNDCETLLEEGKEKSEAEAIATIATIQNSFKAGDEILVPITITDWDNAYAYITVSIPEFDKSLLKFEGFEESEIGFAGAMVEYGSNGFVLIASPSSNVSAEKVKGGEVCILKFVALKDIENSTTISANVEANGYFFGSEDDWTLDRILLVNVVDGGLKPTEGEVEDPTVIYGDCDGNGLIDATDALIVLQASVDKIVLTAEEIVRSDVDGNGVADATDALYILQYSVDKISTFPIENK